MMEARSVLKHLGAAALMGLAAISAARAQDAASLVPQDLRSRGTLTVSFRQQVTPDHLLGRVTAAFWVLIAVPAPIGTATFAALASRIGVPPVLVILGCGALVLVLIGLSSPLRRRHLTPAGGAPPPTPS